MSLLHLEPVGWYEEGIGLMDEKHFDSLQPVYTEAQLKAEIEATKEKAAKVCEEYGDSVNNDWNKQLGVADDLVSIAEECAAAIRNMK